MTAKSRIARLEEKANPAGPQVIRVFFHDDEKGYTTNLTGGPFYPTEAALFKAQGWEDSPNAVHINVEYADGQRDVY